MVTRHIQINEEEVKSEEKVHIYPLQEKRKENFMSLAIPVDDNFLFCEDCNYKYIYECPLHALIPVQDPNVFPECEKGLDSNYSRRTLPQGLAIKKSNIEGAGLGVFATKFLPARTRFGPYVGKKEKNEDVAHESGYSWQIFKDGKPSHFVNASDPSYSNWMRFVNCARNKNEQCVTAYQHAGEIYYRTNRDVCLGTELLVYYGDSFAKELGIDIQFFGKGGQIMSSQESDLPRVDNLIIPTSIDRVFDPSQEDRLRSVEDQMYLGNHMRSKCNVSYHQMRSKCNDSYHQMKLMEACREQVDKYLLQNIKKETSPDIDIAIQLMKNETHVVEKPFKCDVCWKGFTQNGHLTVHKRTHTGEKPFKCDVCGKVFTCSSQLTAHKRTHLDENQKKAIKCDICGRVFKNSGLLTIHERTHSGEKPFKCDVCGNGFIQSSHLTIHKKTHSAEKPFKCDVCEQGFTQSNYLTIHKKTHSGEKRFNCDVCWRSFKHSCHLTIHQRTHTGEKPFKCDVCGKGFTIVTDLTRHKTTHSGEKPYKCDVCEKSYRQPSVLTIHKRTHTGERPYKCYVCGKSFANSSHQTRHQKVHSREKYLESFKVLSNAL